MANKAHLARLKQGMLTGIVKLTAERKNTFHSAAISSGSEALMSHLGI
jgi:hypothetical protein